MTPAQLTLDLWPAERRRDPATCRHVRKTCDFGGGRAQCGAYGDGRTWTNCVALGRCTLMEEGGADA
jgi:hypothetical protein